MKNKENPYVRKGKWIKKTGNEVGLMDKKKKKNPNKKFEKKMEEEEPVEYDQ